MPQDDSVRFLLKIALRKALKLIRGLRKQISDIDKDIMAKKLLDELDVSGWEITKKPGGNAGFTFEPPEGPDTGTG